MSMMILLWLWTLFSPPVRHRTKLVGGYFLFVWLDLNESLMPSLIEDYRKSVPASIAVPKKLPACIHGHLLR
jgi:hypothetical protein